MITRLYKISGLALVLISIFVFSKDAMPKDIEFQFLNIEQLSRYTEDRVAYVHIEKSIDPYLDNSLAQLLIIKDSKVYLLMDGFDDQDVVNDLIFTEALTTTLQDDFFPNKIDGKPDYIKTAERRKVLISSDSQEFVTNSYGEFYTTVRDTFLRKQAVRFKALYINKTNNNVFIERTPVVRKINDNSPVKYKISVTAIGAENIRYFAEDADGDGITETFTVTISDGFDWGFKSGPNIVNIQNNTQEYITAIIGKIVDEAYHGSKEEQEIIQRLFPPEKIGDMIDDIYRSNDPNVQKLEEESGKK